MSVSFKFVPLPSLVVHIHITFTKTYYNIILKWYRMHITRPLIAVVDAFHWSYSLEMLDIEHGEEIPRWSFVHGLQFSWDINAEGQSSIAMKFGSFTGGTENLWTAAWTHVLTIYSWIYYQLVLISCVVSTNM